MMVDGRSPDGSGAREQSPQAVSALRASPPIAGTPIVITGGTVLPDGRLYASFVWPFAKLSVPDARFMLVAGNADAPKE